ncbi:jasmonate-induced protein homolog [Chenopodium quinoa]|uniref:jasmonate-induced protein homolog n=1 Tax=Chenopodium quinoa TaxID=63459 RepID=UPI000B77BA26|nr:jasmonate-induced protein homolog [Chenopodium quinoa]
MSGSSTESEMMKGEEVHLNDEEIVTLDEMIEKGESWCLAEDVVTKSVAVVAKQEGLDKNEVSLSLTALAGTLKNLTKGPLEITDDHHRRKWDGYFVKRCPSPLTNLGYFVQAAVGAKGAAAGVLYTGRNRRGDPCGWLLAWSDSKANGLRIYARCGLEAKFKNLDWDNDIKPKLDVAGSSVNVHDNETGTSVIGKIVGSSGKDLLVAAFAG